MANELLWPDYGWDGPGQGRAPGFWGARWGSGVPRWRAPAIVVTGLGVFRGSDWARVSPPYMVRVVIPGTAPLPYFLESAGRNGAKVWSRNQRPRHEVISLLAPSRGRLQRSAAVCRLHAAMSLPVFGLGWVGPGFGKRSGIVAPFWHHGDATGLPMRVISVPARLLAEPIAWVPSRRNR